MSVHHISDACTHEKLRNATTSVPDCANRGTINKKLNRPSKIRVIKSAAVSLRRRLQKQQALDRIVVRSGALPGPEQKCALRYSVSDRRAVGFMDTRKHIIEATDRLMRTKGISRLTTKQIAQEAGLAEGTLFNQFGSKDNLILAVVAERAPQNLLGVLLEQGPPFLKAIGTAGENTVEANLRRIGHSVIQFYGRVLPVLVSVFCDSELLARFQAAERERNGGPQYMLRVIEGYIRAEQELGRIHKKTRPGIVASSLVGPCFQWVFVHYSMGDFLIASLSEKQFIKELVANLYRGLIPAETRHGRLKRR